MALKRRKDELESENDLFEVLQAFCADVDGVAYVAKAGEVFPSDHPLVVGYRDAYFVPFATRPREKDEIRQKRLAQRLN